VVRDSLPDHGLTRDEERDDNDHTGGDLQEHETGTQIQGFVLFVSGEDGGTRADQSHGDDNGCPHRSHPGERHQEEDVPFSQACGPVQDSLQEDVVEDIPDAEQDHKGGKLALETAVGKFRHRPHEDQGRYFSDHFHRGDISLMMWGSEQPHPKNNPTPLT